MTPPASNRDTPAISFADRMMIVRTPGCVAYCVGGIDFPPGPFVLKVLVP